ncbi:MAG: hypothetical protein KAU48_14405, partial [Candidatus Thorarchaeota archaeon]|nr:hypothetical protein [Candidatus Thorarchaeota archaeon]
MSSHLRYIAIICVSLWLSSAMITTPTEALVTLDNSQHQIAETDLSRVNWKLNHISNPGMEEWTTTHDIDDVATYRTTEHYSWYAQDPWPVNEGFRSRGFQSRAIDPNHPGVAYVGRSSWLHWDNPTNLTMKFDWYIDSIPQPIDYDYFRFNIYLGAPGDVRMYYYFNCEEAGHTNTSNYMYFFLDGPAQTWNTFDRNITEDFFEIAGHYPTQFQQFRFEQSTRSSDYSRAFIDDLEMANGTIIYGGSTGNGNFETSSGWHSWTNNDAADISRSSINQEGDWSLNATAKSVGNQSRLSISYYPDRRLSSMNPDAFSFQWMMNEFDGANEDTFAYVSVSCYNESESFEVFYVLAYGDNTNTFTWEGAQVINVTDFNTTGQWNTFSRSIWNDISSVNQTDFLVVENIEIYIRADGPTSCISILFDDMHFQSAAMDDMGYEDQGDIGDEVLSWGLSSGFQPEFTVTDTAYSGSKAANLTLIDGNSWSEGRDFENRYINDNTDLWLDFFWRIENDTAHAENLMYLEVYFETGETLAYIFANHSVVPTNNGFDEYIILPEVNTEGIWINFQRNLFDDFVTAFGSDPDTEIEEFYLFAEADTGGRFEVLFDDVYLYNDPAPEISGIQMTSQVANQAVNISATVSDLSSFTVELHYRVNGSSWTDVAMVDTGTGFNGTIPGQTWGTQIDFYIE